MNRSIKKILSKSKHRRLSHASKRHDPQWAKNQLNLIFDQITEKWTNVLIRINTWAESNDLEVYEITNKALEARTNRNARMFDQYVFQLSKEINKKEINIEPFFN